MKCTWIVNGRIQLAITAESDLEKAMLQELMKGEVANQWHDKIQIADKALVDTAILVPATSPVNQ